jgi:L-alanine-DL-glutamate epimerase-like enolase superfamily enzyme
VKRAAHWTRALEWAIGLAAIVAVGWATLDAVAGKSGDALYITLGDTRSRAAEVREIAHNAGSERLTATYVRAQAGQLEPRIEALRNDLMKSESRGSTAAGLGRRAADRLVTLTRTLGERADTPPAAGALEAEASVIVDELLEIERRERPN